ncbi:membrane protein [Streptococcus pseudoporcinus]|uniref:Membrane protein n=1 Tax=Streptococcus pseudoporcinus TaxID=361101 RepID=A0A4U9XKI5_9STRE|nr:DUF975 family protein [Streptococcus pseudoporcinus]VTS13556.1 membrane protein [Streptococcus pseudoporcinus]
MKLSQYKAQARSTLKGLPGKYQLFILPILSFFFLISIQIHQNYLAEKEIQLSIFASIFPTILNIVSTLFTLSAAFTILKVIRHQQNKVSFSDLGLSFSSTFFWKIILLGLIRWLLLLVWSLIFLVGVGITGLAIYLYQIKGLSVALFPLIIGIITTLVGAAIAINRQYAYSKSQYILFDQLQAGSYTGLSDIIDKSVSLTKGYKWKNFLLHLSFLGWFILLLLSFGILIIYIYPYFMTSELYFYEDLITSNKEVK